MNAVEREPVETRVLNPNASEASYKPKQRSFKKTKLRIFFIFFRGDFGRGEFVGGDFILEPYGAWNLEYFSFGTLPPSILLYDYSRAYTGHGT